MLDRRALLIGVPASLAGIALACAAPTAPTTDGLYDPLSAYEAETGGRIGLYAENLITGATLRWRADERFVMCSTFKASLAALVLARVDHGQDRLDAEISFGEADLLPYAPVARQNLAKGVMSVDEMCKAIVELSDNTCANLLLQRVGGPAAVTAFWREIGDGVSRLDHNEPELNRSPPGDPRDTTTPAAMAQTVRRLVLGDVLAVPSRARMTDWMIHCQTGAKRLRSGFPATWTIGDKTGSNGNDASGDLAVAWTDQSPRVVAAVYTQGGAPLPARLDAVFQAVGSLIGRQLG